jgi:hypothetical protein
MILCSELLDLLTIICATTVHPPLAALTRERKPPSHKNDNGIYYMVAN